MAIRLDFTRESVVIICDKCPHWREIRAGRLSAWGAAAAHEQAAHDGEKQATLAFGMARRRQQLAAAPAAPALVRYTPAAK